MSKRTVPLRHVHVIPPYSGGILFTTFFKI